ncbi:predicted protein [Plenodomus lingam JN3]|uniref:Predicted protein n=2 Tax=Leptosphaeria maculans TaxID=5022 RepID=E4ZZI6_LEPMJ|nr:predicted protein [Plenodomus lingam JN3]CBX97102.1 predicted protein [Plenodomus lingam JN3]
MTVARPPIHDILQRRLLHLDCSADLQPYSRNLGPGVQEKAFQWTSDVLRAQLEEHREFLLRQQQHEQGTLNPILQSRTPVAPGPESMPRSHDTHAHMHATPLFRPVSQPQRTAYRSPVATRSENAHSNSW